MLHSAVALSHSSEHNYFSVLVFYCNRYCHVDLYNLSLFLSEGEVMEKSAHPTAIMLTSTVNLLKTLSLSSGIHAEVMQVDAVSTLCGLLRILVDSGANDKTGIFFINLLFF